MVVLAAATLSAQQRPTFRGGVSTVSIYATVRAGDGSLVTDLTKDDFEIRDNGRVSDIAVFSREIVPITVTMLLDMSGSQAPNVDWMRDAGNAFVDELLSADRARVGTFGREIAISPRLTGDKTYLRRVLAEEIWPGGSTPLWDAMDEAMSSLRGEAGRRVILALTDGFDSTSPPALPPSLSFGPPPGPQTAVGRSQAAAMAAGARSAPVGRYAEISRRTVREDFMVYAVSKNPPLKAAPMGSNSLSSQMMGLAMESGGGFQIFAADRDAASAMRQVAEELHHQYLIGFTPSAIDNRLHKLEVKVRRDGLSVRARRTYLADGR